LTAFFSLWLLLLGALHLEWEMREKVAYPPSWPIQSLRLPEDSRSFKIGDRRPSNDDFIPVGMSAWHAVTCNSVEEVENWRMAFSSREGLSELEIHIDGALLGLGYIHETAGFSCGTGRVVANEFEYFC